MELTNYIRAYEDMFVLEVLGLSFMFISGYYFLKLYFKKRTLDEKQLKRLFIKGGLVSGFATILTINAFRI